MADGKKDILVDALIGQSAKHADLPSDGARWAWLLMMGAAKFQMPPGEFRTERHLRACLGEYGRHAPALIAAGFFDQSAVGTLTIHDWKDWQSESHKSRDRMRVMREKRRFRVVGDA